MTQTSLAVQWKHVRNARSYTLECWREQTKSFEVLYTGFFFCHQPFFQDSGGGGCGAQASHETNKFFNMMQNWWSCSPSQPPPDEVVFKKKFKMSFPPRRGKNKNTPRKKNCMLLCAQRFCDEREGRPRVRPAVRCLYHFTKKTVVLLLRCGCAKKKKHRHKKK